jgi:cytidylate kinase
MGIDAILRDLLQDLSERDARDSERSISPLKPADDAIVINTTHLNKVEVMAQVMDLVQKALSAP